MKVNFKISNYDNKLPSNQGFGAFFSILFGILFFFFGASISKLPSALLFGLSIGFFFFTMVMPNKLFLLNKLWFRFGLVLSMISRPIVLSLIYFVIFTPISIFMRAFNRDELRLNSLESNSSTFWKDSKSTELSSESFRNQF